MKMTAYLYQVNKFPQQQISPAAKKEIRNFLIKFQYFQTL